MKIVFFAPKFYPDIGGVEKHVLEVAKELSKKHEITIITEGKVSQKEFFGRIKITRLNFGKNDWFKKFVIWGKLLGLRKTIERADVVHCHDVFFWYLPLRIIYPTKKVFITFHGYETTFPPTYRAIFIRRLSEKLSNGSIAIGDYINKWYGTRSKIILYGAADQTRVKSIKRANQKKLRILFIGRIEEDTGVKVYSKTLSLLQNYVFEACGDGKLRKEFERFGRVHGFVQNLNKYIKSFDIVFASSYLSIIYSMNHKKSVFSVYENPLKRDYINNAPFSRWIYSASSPKILKEKIKKIIKNYKLREKNINLAYNWAREHTWKDVTKKYFELWNIRE